MSRYLLAVALAVCCVVLMGCVQNEPVTATPNAQGAVAAGPQKNVHPAEKGRWEWAQYIVDMQKAHEPKSTKENCEKLKRHGRDADVAMFEKIRDKDLSDKIIENGKEMTVNDWLFDNGFVSYALSKRKVWLDDPVFRNILNRYNPDAIGPVVESLSYEWGGAAPEVRNAIAKYVETNPNPAKHTLKDAAGELFDKLISPHGR